DIPPFIPPTVRVTRARPQGISLVLSLMTLVLALLLMPALDIAAPRDAASVLFIATGNVPAGKFRLLADIGREHGIAADIRYVDKMPAEAGPEVFTGYDAVFFDTYLQDMVRGRLAHALPGLKVPQVRLYDGQPAWNGVPDTLAK